MAQPTPQTRDEALLWIAASSVLGYLGLFVGTGFSKAATRGQAPSFEELLRTLASRFGRPIDFDNDPGYRRKSYPQIASYLLNDIASRSQEPARAVDNFREEIARICNLAPDPSTAIQLRTALESVRPAWLVTTNYDLILEALIEDSESVLPSSPLVPKATRPPIYHLHGHRHHPGTIKVTEEDYVGLLGPIDYQRLKLPLLLFESTTVMLGYALGDINVRAAMGWSGSFQRGNGVQLPVWQGRVFHAVRKDSPNSAPYLGADGQIVLETPDIKTFLEEVGAKRREFDGWLQTTKMSIEAFLASSDNSIAVTTDPTKRKEFLEIVGRGSLFCPPTRMVEFLSRVLEPVWTKAREDGGFDYYDTYITLLIDILEKTRVENVGPAVMFYLADSLERVGWYVDRGKPSASAWAATDTWFGNHQRISIEVKRELKNYADAYFKVGLLRLLEYAGMPSNVPLTMRADAPTA